MASTSKCSYVSKTTNTNKQPDLNPADWQKLADVSTAYNYAYDRGSYANIQGDYAKAQGNYALTQVTGFSTTYLKLDQTTPQTTVGTFTFPAVNITNNLSVGNDINLKELLINGLNREIQNKIISGFVWRDMKVWLSIENQMNYKNTYDLAIQTNGSILPITFKFGDVETPIYYQFNDIDDLSDFYLKMSKYIADTLLEGWNKKDDINWTNY